MAQPLLKLEAIGYRDAVGRFSKRTDELQRAMRDEMRSLGRTAVSTLRHYAPKDTEEFAQGIAYRTDERGSQTTLTIYVKGKHAFLLPFLTEGTPAHLIPRGGAAEQMAKGYPLHWIDKGTGEHRFAYQVWHPGTQPDPFVALATDALSPQAAMALGRVARRVIWLA
uniref:Tail protein n=1 Tax=viral metagenome TaxID=1070528 RepID=A0A6M3X7T7_9ZZZZ